MSATTTGPGTPLQQWEIESLQKTKSRWNQFHYSIIYSSPGLLPQTKGSWTDFDCVVEMIHHLKAEEPPGTALIVVSVLAGEISADDADEWLTMHQVQLECAAEEIAYLKAGVCSQCGACSLDEAETKCRPSPVGDTGDYSCDGERLWEEERQTESDEANDEDEESIPL